MYTNSERDQEAALRRLGQAPGAVAQSLLGRGEVIAAAAGRDGTLENRASGYTDYWERERERKEGESEASAREKPGEKRIEQSSTLRA